jgi:hypothetical protein
MNVQLALVAAATALVTAVPAQAQQAATQAPPPVIAPIQVGVGTNITISGLLAVGLKQSEITQGSAATARPGTSAEYRLDDNTSRLVIGSTSRIKDGWNVIFRIESRFQADVRPSVPLTPAYGFTGAAGGTQYNPTGANTGWADGDTWGGISSPYGTVTFGKSTLYYTDTIGMEYLGLPGPGESYRIWDANGLASFNLLSATPLLAATTATGAVAGGVQFTMGNSRTNNVLKYNSIKFGKVFDFSIAVTKQNGDEARYSAPTPGFKNYENGGTLYAKANYNDGPLTASLSLLSQKAMGGSIALDKDTNGLRAGVAYTLPIKLKVGIVVDKTSVDNGSTINGVATKSDRTVIEIPVAYYFGDHGVYATYTKAGDTAGIANSGATQLNLCYDYALTKRAFIGVAYSTIKNQANGVYSPFLSGTTFGGTGTVKGETWSQIGINFNYWF